MILVGILSGTKKKKRFSGDEQFFQMIQFELEKRGGLSFVFTPKMIDEDFIEGYVFKNERWEKKIFPYPHVVYNRLPSRNAELSKPIQTFFNTLQSHHIPYFNKRFITKWEQIKMLNDSSFFPDSERLTDSEKAYRFLKRHAFIYIKPVSGKVGKGISTLTYDDENNILLKTQTNSKTINRDDVQQLFSLLLKQSHTEHLLQQGIHLRKWNEWKYDFRILLIKPHDTWKIIGIGVRATSEHNITTHTLRGGTILPLETIQSNVNINELTIFALEIVKKLTEATPFLKECSLDIGQDEDGHFWLFEVNTKPMTFDEREIQKRRVQTLSDTFYFLKETKTLGEYP